MSRIGGDGWTTPVRNNRQTSDFEADAAPPGKKWDCCPTCQGKGKILVEDAQAFVKTEPASASTSWAEGVKRCAV